MMFRSSTPVRFNSSRVSREGGKGWLMLSESARLLRGGERVLYLDFEDTAPSIVARLLALGG